LESFINDTVSKVEKIYYEDDKRDWCTFISTYNETNKKRRSLYLKKAQNQMRMIERMETKSLELSNFVLTHMERETSYWGR